MPLCNFQLCSKGFFNRHGNKKYCSYECYYEEKKLRSIATYAQMKHSLKGRDQTYASLRTLHRIHGENPIPFSIHEEYNIDWGFFDTIRIFEGIKYRVVGKLGWIRFQDHSIKIKAL
jgi:hypothetical protein